MLLSFRQLIALVAISTVAILDSVIVIGSAELVINNNAEAATRKQVSVDDGFLKTLNNQYAFKKIDDHLFASVASEDSEANMEEAKRWLAEREIAEANSYLGQLGLGSLDALRLLTSLDTITWPSNQCNRDSFSILLKNDKASKGLAGPNSSSRVEKIVYAHLIEHAKRCRLVYKSSFERLYAKLEPFKRQCIESVFDDVIRRHFYSHLNGRAREKSSGKEAERYQRVNMEEFHLRNVLYERFIMNSEPIRGIRDAQLVLDALRYLSQSDPERQKTRMSPPELFEKYLIKPCEYYLHELGPDVFLAAQLDAKTLEKEKLTRAESVDLTDYMRAWARFRLCQDLTNTSAKSNLLKEIQKIVEQSKA